MTPLPPTATPTPTRAPPTLTPTPAVRVSTSEVTLPTYPYANFLRWQTDPQSGVPFASLNRAAYESSKPQPAPKTYRVIELENEVLVMRFLP